MPEFHRVGHVVLHAKHRPAAGRPDVVFLNALGTDLRLWDGVLAHLGGRVATLSYDKQGHGLSGLRAPALTLDDHVDDLTGLMALLGIERAVLVGDSIGGAIAQRLAQRHPERVSGLVLLDTATRFGTPAGWQERIAKVELEGVEAVADAVMEKWFPPAFQAARPADLAGWRTMLARTDRAGYVASCRALIDCDLAAETARLAMPVAIGVGSLDGSTPPDQVRALADLLPQAEFRIFEGVGHLPPAECPGDVAAMILKFIAAHKLG